jgi:hypothetical protein
LILYNYTCMGRVVLKSWRELVDLGYFKPLNDGRLVLTVDGLDGLVDFHTHLAWTTLIAPPVDLNRKTPRAIHNFAPEMGVDLDIYSGQNAREARFLWGWRDFLPCGFCPLPLGKHHTHTIPNLLREMDALKIVKSVCLSVEIFDSKNTPRHGRALAKEPRLVFYCMVHPKDRNREELIDEYLAMGAVGMKVHPPMQRVRVDDESLLELLDLWKEKSKGLPVLFHSGYNGFEPKLSRTNAAVKLFYPAVKALEGSPCILGHAGMNFYQEAIAIAKKHPHVYLEIGGQPPTHIKEMIKELGPDRLLFGSDWPIYPQALPLAKILIATEDNPNARAKILRDNARKLLAQAHQGKSPQEKPSGLGFL